MRGAALAGVAAALATIAILAAPGSAVADDDAQATAASTAGSTAVQVTTTSSQVRDPLVMVVDLSGSMLEDDGTGVVKLDGAKTGLLQVVRNQPVGGQVGLWTYPSDGDCSPGAWVKGAELDSGSSSSSLEAHIRALQADGNTPTGPALQAVADDLRSRGIGHATIMLVSDGLSNCGAPPCDVAQGLRDSGFDLTVMTMGFRIDDEGRDELQCVADATGGRYADAGDSDELEDLLKEVGVPQLGLEVQAPIAVASGMGVSITATVSNPSAQAVSDVSLALTFQADEDDAVMLGAQPPRYRLGNIQPGGSVTRTWSMSTPVQLAGTSYWRVSTWASGIGSLQEQGTIAVSDEDPSLDRAGPLVADALAAGPLLILGDSYSSGEGTGTYIEGDNEQQTLCHRSYLTYGVAVAGEEKSDIIACSGAVTSDLLASNPSHDVPAQLTAVEALDEAPGLVALTFGGNDIGFKDVVTSCLMWGSCGDDADLNEKVVRRLGYLQSNLEQAYREVNARVNAPDVVAERGTVAPILVLPYPQVLPDAQTGFCTGFERGDIEYGNRVLRTLDGIVERAVTEVAGEGVPVYFVSDAQDAMLPNHTSCAKEPYVNTIDPGRAFSAWWADKKNHSRLNELMHPNADGHRATTNAILAWSQRDVPAVAFQPVEAGAAGTIVASAPVAEVMLDGTEAPTLAARQRDGITVTVTGLAPGTSLLVTVHSEPRVVGAIPVDENGVAEGVVYVPADLPAGAHTLVAEGFDPDGNVVERSAALHVGMVRPWWFWVVGAASAALLLGAIAVFALTLRSRRRL